MNKCNNPKMGSLLHAYELKTLKEKEAEQFELHILECDYCFNELSSFNDEAAILLSNSEVQQEVELQASSQLHPQAPREKFWQRLWPSRTPVVLKPAFVYGLAALLIILLLVDIGSNNEKDIRPIQSIGLYQTRSNEMNVFFKDRSDDAVINFIIRDYNRQSDIVVNIRGGDNQLLFSDDNFSDINDNGLAHLYLSLKDMAKGEYSLEIKIPENNPPLDRIIYSFEIR